MKNWKKVAAILLATVVMGGALIGCGAKEITSDGSGAEGGSEAGGIQVEVTGGAGGYMFENGGAQVEIDAEAEPILEKLGEPQSSYEAPSCAFGDLDKVWTYSGYRVDTYQIEGVDYISDVIFTDDSVSTPEGVSIGDSVDDMKAAYGEPTSMDGSQAIYESGNMKLVFLLDGDTITTIEYLNRKLES